MDSAEESRLEETSLKVRKYKSFGETLSGFDKILPVNLMVGRNNTGKSALLDIIDYATSPSDISEFGHRGQIPSVVIEEEAKSQVLRKVSSDTTSGGRVGYVFHTRGSRREGK
jgi:putative ATP-dependent endonuclease of the OLD family